MIKFNKETHTYTLDGKVLISVTQLMEKYGLSPKYQFVNSEVLQRAADYGTLVHKELEDFIKRGEQGLSFELNSFARWLKKNPKIKDMRSETIVHNDLVAGTVDFIYKDGKETVVADFKTTSKIHKEAVTWQLSIYAYLLDSENYSSTKIKVFHFTPELTIVDLRLKSKNQVEELISAYRYGYEHSDLEQEDLLPATLQEEINQVEVQYSYLESQLNALKKKREIILEKIKNTMEEVGVVSLATEHCKFTYVAPYDKKSIDTEKLKQDHPEIYEKYLKTTTVKSALKVKLIEE